MRRITLITVLSIIGVLAAGAVAVGANLGILDAADDSDVGTLTAAEDLVPSEARVVHVTDPAPGTTPDPAVSAAVEDGIVTITEVVEEPAPSTGDDSGRTSASEGDDDGGDDSYDDDDGREHEDEDEDEDRHEDGHEEHEGREDDD